MHRWHSEGWRAGSQRPPLPCVAAFVAAAAFGCGGAAAHGQWFDALPNVKVFYPSDNLTDVQKLVDEVFEQQRGSQFNASRFAFIFTRGDYKDLRIQAGFYTSVIGAAAEPSEVRLAQVQSINGPVGGATQNFWRSFEGVTLTDADCVWAVSQGSPLRRSVVEGNLYLSDNGGWSSGGFMADTRVHGSLDLGTQQQWFFRNVDLGAQGVQCPIGWNYVFVGVDGLNATRCQGNVPGKVAEVADTPRIAEKPFLVQEPDGKTWSIYVPAVARSTAQRPLAGAGKASIARKLQLGRDVFVARPGMTPAEIEKGTSGKGGVLLTPGIYDLEVPIVVRTSGFVVLGIGFPTLVAHGGTSAIQVVDGVSDVRIAGLLLEAGTPGADGGAPPLLIFGTRPAAAAAAGRRPPPPRKLAEGAGAGANGVISDLFARVGSFWYQGCPQVSVESMLEINSDDVIVDNAWLWQADHDDCSQMGQGQPVASDSCYSVHSMVVNGDRVTVYGLSAEHSVGGDVVSWHGEDGETYFYQCELPYHGDKFSREGYAGYAVDHTVLRHKARGLGIYIIGDMTVGSAYFGSAAVDLQHLVTVVIGQDVKQFANSACLTDSKKGSRKVCFGPDSCDEMRCVLSQLDESKLKGMYPETTATTTGPPLSRYVLSVMTSSQLFAECQTGVQVSFLVDGTWTEAERLFKTAAQNQVVTATLYLTEWPTKLLLSNAGSDSWGFKRITLASEDGELRTVLDSPNGEFYSNNRFWIDGTGGGGMVPLEQEYDVPKEDSHWRIYNHYDVRSDTDSVLMVGADVAAAQSLVEQGGYAGFTLSMGQLWLRPLGSDPFTKEDLQFVGNSPSAFYLYEAQFQKAKATETPTTTTRTEENVFLPVRQSREPSASQSRLRVTVLSAGGLAAGDAGGAEPFVVVVLSDGEAKQKQQFKTGLAHDVRDPKWNHTFDSKEYVPGDALEFVLMEKNFFSSTLLGTAALTASQIYPHGFDGLLHVTPAGSGAPAKPATALHVKVEVVASPSRGSDLVAAALLQRDSLKDGRGVGSGLNLLGLGSAWHRAGVLAHTTLASGFVLAVALSALVLGRCRAAVPVARHIRRHHQCAVGPHRHPDAVGFEPLITVEL